MLQFLNKKDISQSDILKLIEYRIDENLDIEFKRSDEISVINDRMLDKLSVIISSFANTIGGILVFGIETKKRRAREISFINGNEITVEKLQSLLNIRIQKNIEGLEIHKIVFDNDESKSVILFKIPESSKAPHMAYDKKFYKRSNFKEVVMDEYEVRMAYNKTNIADIEFFGLINTGGVPVLHNGLYTEMNFFPKFLIRNISSAIEHTYKFELYIPSALHDPTFSALQNKFSKHDGIHSVFAIANKSPLFQEELTTVIEAKLIVNQENFDVYNTENIIIKLYYSNGIKKHEYSIKDTFRYKQFELKQADFTTKLINNNDVIQIEG